MNWQQRSNQLELLDADDIPFEDIQRNMTEINTINTWLGGHEITLNGLKKLLPKGKPVCIAEIGCGDGNNLQVIQNYCTKKEINAHLIGIDIKSTCIEAAQSKQWRNADFITSDYQSVQFNKKPDIIFSSLFCHHFSNDALVAQVKWMHDNASIGFFINDLQRHPLAYYSIKIIANIFSKSYLLKHDAPLSVARSLRKNEWLRILHTAGMPQAKIEWKWAFRYLITMKNNA